MGIHKDGWRDQAVRQEPRHGSDREAVLSRLRTGPGWSFDGTPYPASVQLRDVYSHAVSALVWADGGNSGAPGWAETCALFDAHVERVREQRAVRRNWEQRQRWREGGMYLWSLGPMADPDNDPEPQHPQGERPHDFFIELPGEVDGAPPVRVSLDGKPTAVYMGCFHEPHPWVQLTRAEVIDEFRAAYCDRTPAEWRQAVERAIEVTAPVVA